MQNEYNAYDAYEGYETLIKLMAPSGGGETTHIRVKKAYPLSALTTFRIGGPCDIAVFPEKREELLRVLRAVRRLSVPFRVIGHGSNLLCADEGYRGAVIITDGVNEINRKDGRIVCDCGVSLSAVAKEAHRASLAGAEFLYGIPGTVGGGIYMNAGAYGGEIKDILESVECYDTEKDTVVTFSCEEMAFGYRHSLLTDEKNYIVLGAAFRLCEGKSEEIGMKMKELIERRREKQPLEFPSAGSTFKRCDGHYTAQMIEEAGLKGLTVGGCQVSEKHAGFIINRGNATSADVKELIRQVQEKIFLVHGVRIECEVEYLG